MRIQGRWIASSALAALLFGAPAVNAQESDYGYYDNFGFDNRNDNDNWFYDYYDRSDRGRGDRDMELGGNDPFGLNNRGRGDRDREFGGDDRFGFSENRGRGDQDREFGGRDPFGFDVFGEVTDEGWADV